MSESAPRVVSLYPAATEIICALGFAANLVGRSHECDFPSIVAPLPLCTKPRFATGGSSKEIDAAVKATLGTDLALYHVFAKALSAARPDIIFTQAQCAVCAVSTREVETAVDAMPVPRPRVVTLNPLRLADLWRDIRVIADAFAARDRGERLISRLTQRVDAVANRARTLIPKPTVVCLEWLDPIMAAGNWVPELVELAGGRNRLGNSGESADWIDWPELAAADPEVLLLIPCGFDIARTRAELSAISNLNEWHALSAVRNGRAFVVDANQYFSRPGPRLVDSLEMMSEMLHPQTFRFGHGRTAWVRLQTFITASNHTLQ